MKASPVDVPPSSAANVNQTPITQRLLVRSFFHPRRDFIGAETGSASTAALFFSTFCCRSASPPQPPPTEPHPLQLPADGEGERGEENGSGEKKTRLLGKQTPVPLLWRSSLNSFPHSCVRKQEDARVPCVSSHEINKNIIFFFT